MPKHKELPPEAPSMRTVNIIEDERATLRKSNVVLLAEDIDNLTAADFIKDLTLIIAQGKKPKKIEVIILSSGGEVFAGLGCIRAIQDARSKGFEVIGRVYGFAGSMAFLILQQCSERVMGAESFIMAHGFFQSLSGDSKAFEAEREMFDKLKAYFSVMLAERNTSTIKEHRSPEFWANVLSDDTPKYYTADEAYDAGLIDEVED